MGEGREWNDIFLQPATLVTQGAPSFGSQAILENCWTPQELRGTPADSIVRNPAPAPAPDPPSRKAPLARRPPLRPDLKNSIRRVKPLGGEKVAALTFDLCESRRERSGYDSEIVNYLRQHRVKATFYAGGKWMNSHPEKTLQLMADPLFELGNHSWSHADLRISSAAKIQAQILLPQAQYELLREELARKPCAQRAGPEEMKKIPPLPLSFRFPYGACSRASLRFLAEQGLPAIQWDVVSADSAPGRTAAAIARTVIRQTRPGSIIVGHANGRGQNTAEALKIFVPALRAQGFQFVTISELLTYGPVFAPEQCYELRPGDNLGYDELFRTKTP